MWCFGIIQAGYTWYNMELLRYGSPHQEAFVNGALFIKWQKLKNDVLPPFATERYKNTLYIILQKIVIIHL